MREKMKSFLTKTCMFLTLTVLTACGNSLDFETPDSTISSYQAVASKIEKQVPGAGKALGRALYRLATPADMAFPSDDFDPLQQILLKTDRKEPDIESQQWADTISKSLHKKYDGMSAKEIFELYHTQDMQALNQQREWANGFEVRARERLKLAEFEQSRRSSLIDRITPSKSSYRWTFQEPRIPVIDFSVFNPLDRQISTIDFKIDLISPKGAVVGSGILSYTPMVPIAPSTTGSYTASVKDIEGLNNKSFMDLKDPLRVSMKIDNIFVGNKEPIIKNAISTSLDKQRQTSVDALVSAIESEKANLFQYRVLAGRLSN